jgi:hypothetical protein
LNVPFRASLLIVFAITRSEFPAIREVLHPLCG